MPMPHPSLLRAATTALLAVSATAAASTHLLFVDRSAVSVADPRLRFAVQPPAKGPRVLWPTEPWESWAVFAYNHVVAGNGSRPHRMYYDCIEGTGVPPGGDEQQRVAGAESGISHRRICLAESHDGLLWSKPSLGIFARNGSTANNILLEDSGVSVFRDGSDGSWKMVCSDSAYTSADGLRWTKLPWTKVSTDDTKPTAYWDGALHKYVVSVRRDCSGKGDCPGPWPVESGRTRYVGRCVTSNISNWQEEAPEEGCSVVFGPDTADPESVDVYTNAWTPYPSPEAPVVHLFFPSMYHHFGTVAPFGFGNDGLLDIRLVVSRDGVHLNYTDTANARSPYVPLGNNRCGGAAHAPGNVDGWCSPYTGIEAHGTDFDTSAMYMASGYVPSNDGDNIYFYSSGQSMTHGGDSAKHLWGNSTGIRVLTSRRDGFVAIEAPYTFGARSALPSFTTVELTVPSCPPPVTNTSALPKNTACSENFPGGKCPASLPEVKCTKPADCQVKPDCCSCRGKAVSCQAGVCASGLLGVNKLCASAGNHTTRVSGGVQLFVNMQTSVVGFVAIEVVGQPGYSLDEADALKGGATQAVASWGGGAMASLSALTGKAVTLKVAMADSKLFSLRLGCA